MNIVHFVSDHFTEYNSGNYRCTILVNAINRSGKANAKIVSVEHWFKQTEEGIQACNWADIIVLHRVLIAESIQHAEKWVSRGKAVTVDFDDAYQLISEENAAYQFWGRGEVNIRLPYGVEYPKKVDTHPIEQFKMGLQIATAGTTPSRILCQDWEEYAPMFYLPNYLDTERYRNIPKYKNNKTVIGYGGSMSHLTSFSHSGVQEALHRLCKERDDFVVLIVGDKRIHSQIGLPETHVKYHPYVMFFDWTRVLARYDIGIAPLAMPYDQRRSRLKVMEYIAMGIPFVATQSEVYRDFSDTESGIYIDQGQLDICDKPNPEEWYDFMGSMLDATEYYKRNADNDREVYFEDYDVDSNVDEILSVYQNIMDSR